MADEYRDNVGLRHFQSRSVQQEKNPWRKKGTTAWSWMQNGEQNFTTENDEISKSFTYVGTSVRPGQSSQSRARRTYVGVMSDK